MSDTTDLAAVKTALATISTTLRNVAGTMDGARSADLLRSLASELDSVRLTIALPANRTFGNH